MTQAPDMTDAPDAGLRSLLADILVAVPGRGATIYTPEAAPDSETGIWCAAGIPSEPLLDYAAHYRHTDPWARAAARERAPSTGAVLDTDHLVASDILKAGEFYNDYLRPNDIGRCLVAIVDDGRGPALPRIRMTVIRAESEPRFSADEAMRFAWLARLARTCVVLDRARAAAEREAALRRAAFDLVRMPVLLVDRERRILQANGAAQALLRLDAPLLSRHGRLQARDATAERDLERLFAAAVVDAGGFRVVRLGPGRRSPLLVLTPLRAAPGGPETVVVRMLDPVGHGSDGAAVLRELLDLTPAECEVALGVAEGLSHDEIARRRGVKVTSVRTTLRRLQEKLGIQRTAPLAHFIQGLVGLGGLRL